MMIVKTSGFCVQTTSLRRTRKIPNPEWRRRRKRIFEGFELETKVVSKGCGSGAFLYFSEDEEEPVTNNKEKEEDKAATQNMEE
mmetsp:Transcript_9325/g.13683  ORF Transcript_9325/g.13683 Transcript_9325/m.13683 type:complete len:84 (+) Transcript_9325:492-743(+)